MTAVSKCELVIIGAGGFGAVAASIAASMNEVNRCNSGVSWELIGYVDDDASKKRTRYADSRVLGTIEEVNCDYRRSDLWFFCAIGDNPTRAKISRRAESLGWKPATLVHPSAIIDHSVGIGPGTCIAPAVVICYGSKVGAHVVVDAQVSLGHDAVLMDHCSVFSGARINGNCQVGPYALIGCNATLLPGTVVGDRAVVGANSLAHGWVEPGATVFGVPVRILRKDRNSPLIQEPVG